MEQRGTVMHYRVLASDYDRTLATKGHVREPTIAALQRWRAVGGRLLLVTGRLLDDLLEVFPAIQLFDLVVAENGALLYWPAHGTRRSLGPQPPAAFVQTLQEQGVEPLMVGHSIVSTLLPHKETVLATLRAHGLDWHMILNKHDVMLLPPEINKASGLQAALAEQGLSADETVGVGDAENDVDFLDACGYRVAVANALPLLKARADLVTQGANGRGVAELIDGLLHGAIPPHAR